MSRERTRGKIVRTIDGSRRLRLCRSCGYKNELTWRVCRGCGREFARKTPRKPKPKRGSVDRLRADLVHAGQMADRWTTKVKAAVTNLHYWNRRERELARRLAAGPQPPRPKVPKPKIRGIRLREEPS